jgi:signal transduction histidine kinase
MPPEVERRVIEPFFTTKGSEGTGLGLANVYAAMQRLGGKIVLATAPGKGTCFRLSFPEPSAASARGARL